MTCPRRPRMRRFRPLLDHLEGRALLATIVVAHADEPSIIQALESANDGDTIDMTGLSGIIDCPGTIVPAFHIWTGSRIDWFDTDDSYPRHAGFRADTRGMDERVAAGGDVDGHD